MSLGWPVTNGSRCLNFNWGWPAHWQVLQGKPRGSQTFAAAALKARNAAGFSGMYLGGVNVKVTDDEALLTTLDLAASFVKPSHPPAKPQHPHPNNHRPTALCDIYTTADGIACLGTTAPIRIGQLAVMAFAG